MLDRHSPTDDSLEVHLYGQSPGPYAALPHDANTVYPEPSDISDDDEGSVEMGISYAQEFVDDGGSDDQVSADSDGQFFADDSD